MSRYESCVRCGSNCSRKNEVEGGYICFKCHRQYVAGLKGTTHNWKSGFRKQVIEDKLQNIEERLAQLNILLESETKKLNNRNS